VIAGLGATPPAARAEAGAADTIGGVEVTPPTIRVLRIAPRRVPERLAPLLGDGAYYSPPTAEDRLAPEDEIALARSLGLVQAMQIDTGLEALRQLAERYPRSQRIVSATASSLTAAGRPEEALRFIDAGVRRAGQAAREGGGGAALSATRRSAADPFALERAEALLALGKRPEAIPRMVSACAESGARQARMRRDLMLWAETSDLGPRVLAAAEKQSDGAPDNTGLALLAAEIECRAGRAERAWPRVARAEAAGGLPERGQLLRLLAERLSMDAETGPRLGVAAWLELARGADHDEALRVLALDRLLSPVALPGEPGEPERDTPAPNAQLEAAWRSLPPGANRARLGIALVEAFRRRGDEVLAQRVISDLGRESTPPELAGELDLAEGLAAVQRGQLAEARASLARARDRAANPEARERAEYALAETRLFGGELDSARAAFDAFAAAHPQSPLANDALERAYLLESGEEGGAPAAKAPGLEALAQGLFAEARQRWDEAARYAHDAEAQARAAHPAGAPSSLDRETTGGAADPVRAHALLLLSRAEERRDDFPGALAAALVVADSLPGDRLAPVARGHAGDLLLARGRAGEALAQYEEMLARYPRSWLAAEVRRKVTDLRARRNP
jgi:tetratricopeptide (TPR) repeat protein